MTTTIETETDDGWGHSKRTVENGLWIHVDREQVVRNCEKVDYDLAEFDFGGGTKGWLIHTRHGVVLVETWKPTPDCPDYIGFHLWIGPCRYWQRIHDVLADDEEQRAAAHSFAETVAAKLVEFGAA